MDDTAAADLVKKLTTSTPFLSKLWRLLAAKETEEEIAWCEDGKQFAVKNKNKLAQKWLVLYGSRSNQFSTFQRQLNYFGFIKVSSSGPYDIYQHDLFQRDQPDLTKDMKRKTNTGNIFKKRKNSSSSPSTEMLCCVVCGNPEAPYMSSKYPEYSHVPSEPVCSLYCEKEHLSKHGLRPVDDNNNTPKKKQRKLLDDYGLTPPKDKRRKKKKKKKKKSAKKMQYYDPTFIQWVQAVGLFDQIWDLNEYSPDMFVS